MPVRTRDIDFRGPLRVALGPKEKRPMPPSDDCKFCPIYREQIASDAQRIDALKTALKEAREAFLRCAVAAGIVYEPEGHAVQPGPLEAVERSIREAFNQRDVFWAELARLRKLFEEAGQGEHNVLDLIDHYQREAIEADKKADAYARDWHEAKSEFGQVRAKLSAELRETRAECERFRTALHNTVRAMREWGSWEDGVPAAGQFSEPVDVGSAYDAAVALVSEHDIPGDKERG